MRALSAALVVVAYACAWTSVRSSAVQVAGVAGDAVSVAWTVVTALGTLWAWALVLVLSLLLLQATLLTALRVKGGDKGRWGDAFQIAFSVLFTRGVLVPLAASMLLTWLFAWVVSARVFAGVSNPDRRRQRLVEAASNAMAFNLAMVAVTVIACGTGMLDS